MVFYLVFSVPIYVMMLRLTIIQSLCRIIIVITQVPPSFKIIVIFKTIIIKLHSTFLNVYCFIISDGPVLGLALQLDSSFFLKIVGCSDKHLEFGKLKKALWYLGDRIYLHLTVAEAGHDI